MKACENGESLWLECHVKTDGPKHTETNRRSVIAACEKSDVTSEQ